MSPARWGLAALVAVGLGLRLWGIGFGLPHPLCRPDEAVLVHRALAVGGGDLNPHFFNYPSLHIYLLAASLGLHCAAGLAAGVYAGSQDFLFSYLADPTAIFLTGRLLTAALGTATVVLAYLAGRRLGGERAGLCAAGFLALAFLHVRDSHFATVDVPATFWILAAYVLCWRYLETGRRRDLWWSAAVLGLAVSTKYNAALFAPALLAAPLLRCRSGTATARGRWREAAGAGAVVAGAFLLGTPWVLLDPSAFWRDVAFEGGHFASGHLAGSHLAHPQGAGWLYHLLVSLWHGPGWPVALLGWAGMAWLARRRHPEDLVLLLGAGLYFAVSGSGRTLFLRYALPLVPLLCVAAGVLIGRLGRRWRPGWVVAAAALVALPGALASWQVDRLLATDDTRLLAARWLEEHVPDGSVVAFTGSEYGHPYLRRSRQWVSERFEELRRAGAPARRLALQLEWADRLPGPSYYAVELRPAGVTPLSSVRDLRSLPQVRAAGVEWLVVGKHPLAYSHVDAALARDLAALEPAVAFDPFKGAGSPRYDPIDAFYIPYAGFDGVVRPGPAVRIYEIGSSGVSPPEGPYLEGAHIRVEAGTD